MPEFIPLKDYQEYLKEEMTERTRGFYSLVKRRTCIPSPMKFLNKILNRPSNERLFLLLVVGYPGKDVKVPDISKKKPNEIAVFI